RMSISARLNLTVLGRNNRRQSSCPGAAVMKQPRCHFSFSVCCALTVAAALAVPVPASADDAPTPQFSYALFDGRSLDGWAAEDRCEAAVEDGLLVLKAGDGWLRSDRTYSDFILHVEWKALKAADYDAGVYIRTLPEGKPFPKTGYQVNLLQGKE